MLVNAARNGLPEQRRKRTRRRVQAHSGRRRRATGRSHPRRPPTVRAMNPAELRGHCLSFTGAEETFPFGPHTSVFKVEGKMFALSQLGADSLRVSLKCEPELAEALRAAHAAVLPGYHLNKRHWNTVVIDGSLSDDTIHDMIEDSYDLGRQQAPASSLSRSRLA